jgi:hypothetical protein
MFIFFAPALLALLTIFVIAFRDQFAADKQKPMLEEIQDARIAYSQEVWEQARKEALGIEVNA